MKYLHLFENQNESYPYEWENIVQKGNKLYIYVYELANEMESDVAGKGKEELVKMEHTYYKLIRNLLIGKVITFDCEECSIEHTGICDTVGFSSGRYEEGSDDTFQVQFVHISTEDIDDQHNIEDEEIIVHLDIDPETYRTANKYNL